MNPKDKVIFVQFSHKLVSPDNPAMDYLRRMWNRTPGFPSMYATEHFGEIPTWIPVIWGKLNVERELLIVDEPDFEGYYNYVTHLFNAQRLRGQKLYLLFSVMDVTQELTEEFIERMPSGVNVIASGYIDPTQFKSLEYGNVHWVDRVEQLKSFFPDHYLPNASPDYSAFQDLRDTTTVPRLSLSEGCLFECEFCTIPRRVTPRSWQEVNSQVFSLVFSPLYFEKIYIDDKTFGQAENWVWLAQIRDIIRSVRPEFNGFIVQTTATYANKYWETWYNNYAVQAIEVGVEVPDDNFLRDMKKPHRMRHVDALVQSLRVARHARPRFIPNLIFGFPNQNYNTTYSWVRVNQDVIDFFNPYILSLYQDQKGQIEGTEREISREINDADENSAHRSWLYPSEIMELHRTMTELYRRF